MEKLIKALSDYYYMFLLPFLSVSVFFAMEYLSRGLDFFTDEKGIRWRYLIMVAIIQFFVSSVITWSMVAIFESEALAEYKTFQMVATILLGVTPFNISILLWVAVKLEIYKLMRMRYGADFKEEDLLDNRYLKEKKLYDREAPQDIESKNKDSKQEIQETKETKETPKESKS